MRRFPCSYCDKICKSKGGLTNHTRRMHAVGEAHGDLPRIPELSSEAIDNMLAEIIKKLRESQLYGEDVLAEVEKLHPSACFYESMGKLFGKFARNLSQDNFLEEFYGKMYGDWETFFPSFEKGKYVFLVLIHLPEKLVNYHKQKTSADEPKVGKHLLF